MSGPGIREAEFDDYGQIAALEERSGLQSKTREEWRHLWEGNPVYHRLQRWPIGWVLEEGGRVVGYIGNIPLLYQFRGRPLLTAAGRAWTVDPAYRTYSLLLMETYFQQPAVDLFLNTTVNDHAIEAFSVFESHRVPVGDWDRSCFWITSHRGFAESALRLKGMRLAWPLSYPLALGLSLKTMMHRTPGGAAEVDQCPRFDERFDPFWERLRCERQDVLLGVRSREALAWHFHHPLQRGELRIAVVRDAGGIQAYGIFMRRDVPQAGLKRMRLVDFQCLNGGRALLAPVLAWALRQCRREGVHALEIVGHGNVAPFQRKLPAWCYFFKAARPQLTEALGDPKAWDPSSFDGDASL